MNTDKCRVNLYDDQRKLWGTYYPQTKMLVRQDHRERVEIDLSPYLGFDRLTHPGFDKLTHPPVDKKRDTLQIEKSMLE